MKNIALTLTLIFAISISAIAQVTKGKDGLYYNQHNELYNGEYVEYFANGNPKVKMNLNHGQKDGRTEIFHERGTLHEVRTYEKGKKHGEWLVFNADGIRTSSANFTKGKKDGTWRIWNDEGILVRNMQYKEGVKVGTWKQFDSTGSQVAERQF